MGGTGTGLWKMSGGKEGEAGPLGGWNKDQQGRCPELRPEINRGRRGGTGRSLLLAVTSDLSDGCGFFCHLGSKSIGFTCSI
jgi:hypothetical protein